MVNVTLMMGDGRGGGVGEAPNVAQSDLAQQSTLLANDLERIRQIDITKQNEVERIVLELERMDGPENKKIKNRMAEAFVEYQMRLEAKGELDFDDLLLRAHVLLQRFPSVLDRVRKRWRHVLVDELQDCNKVQYDLVTAIAPPGRQQDHSVLVVGDVDQSIYGFRGSGVDTIGYVQAH